MTNGYIVQLTKDLDWREAELGAMKILLNRPDISRIQKESLLRAAWALLYAHYEGFVKFSLNVYYDTLKTTFATRGQLPRPLLNISLREDLKAAKKLHEAELVEFLMNFHANYMTFGPIFPEINTKSNLWPNILFDLLTDADLDPIKILPEKTKIQTLVARRNGIAHGEHSIIPEVDYYLGYESAVYDVMYKLVFEIDQKLNELTLPQRQER